MKVKYDKETDVLYFSFNESKIEESDEDKPGIVLDYDNEGGIVGIETLDASKKMKNPAKVEYEIADKQNIKLSTRDFLNSNRF